MSNWVYFAIWAVYAYLTISELLTHIQMRKHNSEPILVALCGPAKRNLIGTLMLTIWQLFTIIWFSYLIFG